MENRIDVSEIYKSPRYLLFLSMLAAVVWIMCLVSQYRIVSIYSGYVCAAVFPYPFLCCILDMIAEIYGYKEVRKTFWSALFLLFIFAIVMTLFAKLPAPLFWHDYTSQFNATMSPMLRIITFGSVGLIIGQYINIYVFSKLRNLLAGNFFGLRIIGSTFIGDTITFAIVLFGDFSGNMPEHKILVMVAYELVIMYALAILLAFPASIVVGILKKIEPPQQYNSMINFNPFI